LTHNIYKEEIAFISAGEQEEEEDEMLVLLKKVVLANNLSAKNVESWVDAVQRKLTLIEMTTTNDI
jgi:hypothetical protein